MYIYIERERAITDACALLLRFVKQMLTALLKAAAQVDSGFK